MLGLVDLQARNDTVGKVAIVIDKRHGPHHPPHSQRSQQLIACRTRSVDSYFDQAVIAVGKRNLMSPVNQSPRKYCRMIRRKPPMMTMLNHQ